MDSVLNQIANQPNAAAEPTSQTMDALVVQDAGTPQTPPTQVDVQGGAPSLSGLPADATAGIPPAAPQTPVQAQPQIDQAAYQDAMRKAQERDQLVQELQQLANQANAQRQAEARKTQLETQRNQIRQLASAMSPDDAIAFVDRQYDTILASREQEAENEKRQLQQQYWQTMVAATAPAYAEHLATTHGLPAEYKQRLAMLSPMDMDRYLPVIKQEYEARKSEQDNMTRILNELDQLKRSQTAGSMAASGAHAVGGSGSAPLNPNASYERGSTEHITDIFRQGGIIQ